MKHRVETRKLAGVFAAFSDPTRLRLLNLMARREVCVCYFVEILQESQPKISRHLAYLRRTGIVRARREGKWMYYEIDRRMDHGVSTILKALLRSIATEREMQADAARLERACCGLCAPGRGLKRTIFPAGKAPRRGAGA